MQKTSEERKPFVKKSTLYGFALVLVLLTVMGKLNWVLAGFSVAVAFVLRFLPVALRFAPQLQRLWLAFRKRGNTSSYNQSFERGSAAMTAEEACKILGIPASATRKEVTDAHRKLIFLNHPDRGGTSYLAAQINRAKEVLLMH